MDENESVCAYSKERIGARKGLGVNSQAFLGSMVKALETHRNQVCEPNVPKSLTHERPKQISS